MRKLNSLLCRALTAFFLKTHNKKRVVLHRLLIDSRFNLLSIAEILFKKKI